MNKLINLSLHDEVSSTYTATHRNALKLYSKCKKGNKINIKVGD